jgi:hypothetical protein
MSAERMSVPPMGPAAVGPSMAAAGVHKQRPTAIVVIRKLCTAPFPDPGQAEGYDPFARGAVAFIPLGATFDGSGRLTAPTRTACAYWRLLALFVLPVRGAKRERPPEPFSKSFVIG